MSRRKGPSVPTDPKLKAADLQLLMTVASAFAAADAQKLQRQLPESVLNDIELFLFGIGFVSCQHAGHIFFRDGRNFPIDRRRGDGLGPDGGGHAGRLRRLDLPRRVGQHWNFGRRHGAS